MNNLSTDLPLWNRVFTSFETALYVTEQCLYGEKKTTGADLRQLFNQIVDANYVFMGNTNLGALYLCRVDLPSGTTYHLDRNGATFGIKQH